MKRILLALAAVAAVVAAGPAAAGAAGDDFSSARGTEASSSIVATAAGLRRPTGTYTGDHGRLQLNADGDSMPIFAFAFKCGSVTGRTALNDVPIQRRRGRYRFSISAHGGVTYSDDQSPDNGAIRLSGRFTPTAKRALGTFRIRTPRCGRTGPVEWSARRR